MKGRNVRHKIAQKADENSEQLVIDLADELCIYYIISYRSRLPRERKRLI